MNEITNKINALIESEQEELKDLEELKNKTKTKLDSDESFSLSTYRMLVRTLAEATLKIDLHRTFIEKLQNLQNKMKLPNDLVKSTDYEKAKDREIHEFECVNGKFVHHYVLGGEHELTEQEVVDCLNALATLDCDLCTAYAFIEGQNERIKELEEQLSTATMYHGCDTLVNELKQENQQLKQSQNQKAIEVLEKIRNYYVDEPDSNFWIVHNRSVVKYLDSQIKELEAQNEV